MPKGSKASLFISSTCYDLSQVRTDLREFAISIGFEPILSDFDSFPVNPSQNTLNNCLEAVRSSADLFLLIVGGRYGSITDTGKSITNLEFLEAKAKGIPKYVFVKEDILALLPIWKNNPDADFSSAVDSPKLLEFISNLRDTGEIWVFPFSSAQDIIKTLRKQLSFLFSESLEVRTKFYGSNTTLTNLQPKALRLAVEKPDGWEYLLFAQVLTDRIESYESKRLDTELGISFGEPIILKEVLDVTSWISSRFDLISSTIKQLTDAINAGFIKAVGESGEPGNIQRIVHLATRISDGYEQLLDWKLQFLRVSVDKDFEKLLTLASNFSSNAIQEIEKHSSNLYTDIENHLLNSDTDGEVKIVKITLNFTVPDVSDFNSEIKKLTKKYS